MKLLKENADGIVFCLFELVVGVLLLVNPVSFTVGIIMVAGVVFILLGLINVARYFRTSVDEAVLGQMLTKGLLLLLAGIFCVWKTEWFIVTFPVLTILYGVLILVAGISKIQLTVDMLRWKNKKWFWAAISAAVSIVCAIVILRSPFATTAVLWMFTGASLIVEGIHDIIAMIAGKKNEGNPV